MSYKVRRDEDANGDPFVAEAVSLNDRHTAAISAWGSTEKEAIARMKRAFAEQVLTDMPMSKETIIWQKEDEEEDG